jgi:hypothetical protein
MRQLYIPRLLPRLHIHHHLVDIRNPPQTSGMEKKLKFSANASKMSKRCAEPFYFLLFALRIHTFSTYIEDGNFELSI